jgi:hypothetical protein
MKASVTILDAIADKNLFAPCFRDPATWAAWRAFLAGLFGLPMDEYQRRTFMKCTGRHRPLKAGASEAWLICGRRAGKSFTLALIAVYLACFKDWRPHLGPGERATIMVIAADRKQARVIMRYCLGLLRSVPMLARIIEAERSESIDLSHNVTIEVHTASFRTVRGYSLVAALADELAFWPTEDSASPDVEILDALRPAMATIPGSMLLCASSPYAQRGALFTAWRKHYAMADDPILIWQAPTRVMNPTVPQSIIDQAMEDDPSSAAAEWMAQFRSDVEAFITREVVDAAVVPDRRELLPVSSLSYVGFADPSGGSSDSFTLSIAHRDKDGHGILDAVREVRPPFAPDAIVAEYAQLLKSYRLHRVTGDRYGGDWPAERFRAHGITYEASERSKSQLYGELLPLLNSSRTELLDHPRLVTQLCGLERRTARSGRDSIDHGPGGHDDVANACAGALVLATGQLSEAQKWDAFGKSPHVRALLASGPDNCGSSAVLYARMRGW